MPEEEYDIVSYTNSKSRRHRTIAQSWVHHERLLTPLKYIRAVRTLVSLMGKKNGFSMEDVDDKVKAMFGCTNKPDLESLLHRCERERFIYSRTEPSCKGKSKSHYNFYLSFADRNIFMNLLLLFGDYIVNDHYRGRPMDGAVNTVVGSLIGDTLHDDYSDCSLFNLLELHTKGDPVHVAEDRISFAVASIQAVKYKVIDDIIIHSPVFKSSRIDALPALFDTSIIMHADVASLISSSPKVCCRDEKLVKKGNTYVLGDIVTIDLDENKNNLLLQ